MKYYCKKQDVTVEINKNLTELGHLCLGACYSCSNMQKVSAYETVKQWEERTDKVYPKTAPVFWTYDGEKHWACDTWDWYLHGLYKDDALSSAIVATEAGAPPPDWRPV